MAHAAWVTMTRVTGAGACRLPTDAHVDAGMKELNEMTIGRTEDPENPLVAPAFKAAFVFGTGSRNPSWPSDHELRQPAGHMIAVALPAKLLIFPLASEGPPTHATKPFGAKPGFHCSKWV
jgi:hypothetical protein